MSQRSFNNPRNQNHEHKGATRKSASSAKPATRAASSVYVPSRDKKKPKDAKTIKEESRAQRRAALDRESALLVESAKSPQYKRYRRIWIGSIIVAFVAVALSWLVGWLAGQDRLPEPLYSMQTNITLVLLILSYGAIFLALYMDLGKMRKYRKKAEADAANLSKRKAKRIDAQIEEQKAAGAKSKRGFHAPWKKSEKTEQEEPEE